mmetsp:Transcript_3137/g.11204  ORF Transcript_3137/g.11204 Transcript_3137/m.11204 type:complete len:92 (+) Transcript_3137:480-755(+)
MIRPNHFCVSPDSTFTHVLSLQCETSILSVLFGGIVESAFEENVLHNNAFSLSRCNRVFLGFEESIDRSKIVMIIYSCVSGNLRDEFRMKR